MKDRGYTIKRSRRRTISIEITEEEDILVRAPKWVPLYEIDAYVESNRKWIEKHKEKVRKRNERSSETVSITFEELERLADDAVRSIPERVRYFADTLDVSYGRISIRNQKTLWGSCSAKGNLSFNCLLMKVPDNIRDYVIVHELCHRLEMNHSAAFWEHVGKAIPDYKECRKWLKNEGVLYTNAVRRLYQEG